ncbi:MAG: hypothetical protein R6X33_10620 [Candidatus Brocadiia bacterium]
MKNLVFLVILALVGAIIYTLLVDDEPLRQLQRSTRRKKGTSVGEIVKTGKKMGNNTADAIGKLDLSRKE